jgi:DNA-binding GntR family transcriptional regulator
VSARIDEKIEGILEQVLARNPGEVEFHQSVREVLETLGPVLAKRPEFAEYTETVRARLATKQESSALALSPGAPVIHLTRNAVTEAGRVVEVCDTIMAADQFVLDYRIPATD